MTKIRRSFLATTVLMLLGTLVATPLMAQRTTATLRGTVTTEDDVAVGGANVVITGTNTGLNRTVVTDLNGRFLFPELPVGDYELQVEFPNFKTAVVEEIELGVADVREMNIQLQVGEFSDEVTVKAPIVLVETIGGEVSSTVSGEEIRELPLNGRNFTQLTQLMPGVSAPDGLDFKNKGLLSGVDLSVSGSSVTANQWVVDGAANNDVGSNRTILITPSVDAIEEFKIHRNSYGPEFGGAGGAQINLVTKSGTNQYRGSAFFFHRDDSLNEPNALLERAGADKEEIDRQDYGYTFGGPIVRDRVHFFVNQEWNDETRGTVRSATVPTAAERMGDFSQSGPCSGPIPVDPLTGEPFPGNVIPADRLSDAGVNLLNLYPSPNANASAGNCANWVGSVPTDIDWLQTSARIDATVTDSSTALVRYTKDDWDNPAVNAGQANGLWGDDPFPAVDSGWNQPGESLVAQVSNVFGGNKTNLATFSWSHNEIDITRGGTSAALNNQLNGLIPAFFPEGEKTHGADRSHPVYWGGATGQDLWNIAPWSNEQDLYVFKNDYQQVFGDHWLKAGVLYSDNSKQEDCCGASAFETPHFWGGAGINGWGATSGNRIADILIKDMYHGYDETAFQPSPELEWQDIEVYIGDSWTVSSNLTVDYGVRWSKFDQPEAKDDNIAAFYTELWDPALGNATCNGVAQVPGTDPCGAAGLEGGGQGVNGGFVEDDDDNFAPRVSAAWNVFGDGNSVLRAGFGQYYQRERVNIQLDFGGQPPFTRNTSGIRPLDNADPTFLAGGFGTPNRGIDPDNETPYNLQWNLTWEQRLGPEASVEVSYVGNRGKHLVTKSDINQVPPGDNDGDGVDDRLQFATAGGDGDGSVRPYFTGAGNRILYWETDGESEYDALQTQFRSYFGRGSIFQTSYTYSDFQANTSVASSSAGEEPVQITDRYNRGLDWGPADLHRRHILNSSLVWNGPAFEGRGSLFRNLLGNWTVGTVASYATGTPITVYVASVPGLGGGGIAGTGYADNNRPIQLGSCGGGGGAQVINPDSFTLDGFRLGDTSQMSGRGQCEGPDFFQVDLAFYKNIPLRDRFNLQFRVEVFNVTDETNYIAASVNNTIIPQNVVYSEDGTTIVSADFPADFGQATAVRDPRQVQLGFKLSF